MIQTLQFKKSIRTFVGAIIVNSEGQEMPKVQLKIKNTT
jgi:hypothetical protein